MDEVEDTGHEEADVKGDEQAADVEQPDQKVTQVNPKANTSIKKSRWQKQKQ